MNNTTSDVQTDTQDSSPLHLFDMLLILTAWPRWLGLRGDIVDPVVHQSASFDRATTAESRGPPWGPCLSVRGGGGP